MVRLAGALRDRAGVHVAVVDVPAVLALGIAAAGEGGHALLKREHRPSARRYGLWTEVEGPLTHILDGPTTAVSLTRLCRERSACCKF
jgi:hypothetical protein